MREYEMGLMRYFEDSFINNSNELILVPKTNLYFRLDDVYGYEDFVYKIFAWCSRDASKSEPYHTEWRNQKYREYVRNNLNTFLGVEFSEEKWSDIYSEFGNGCNKDECLEFIRKEIKWEE